MTAGRLNLKYVKYMAITRTALITAKKSTLTRLLWSSQIPVLARKQTEPLTE